MTKAKIREAAKRANRKAESWTDTVLSWVADAKYSWLLLVVYSAALLAIGKFYL